VSNRALAIFLLLVGMAAGRPNLRARRHLSQRQPHLRFVKEYVRELIADESLKLNGEKEFGEAKTDNERIADRKVGRRLGVCCVYYPRGPWDTAETIMYPNIVTKGPGQATLRELMDSDLARFSKDNPGGPMSMETSHSMTELPSCAISMVSMRALRRPLPTSTKKRSLPLWC